MTETHTIPAIPEFDAFGIDNDTLKRLYTEMLYPRMIEEKMIHLLRQGRVSKWFSGIGQEAISVGCTCALAEDELLFTMHRNLGVFTSRKIPLQRLVAQWQGKAEGFTKGRDRSFHFGTMEYGIVGMISHLGPQLSLASGVALAHKIREEQKVALAFTGEGGTSQGEFHEALNVASVWDIPVIFIIENNGYGLSTPVSEQYKIEHLADRGAGYGIESYVIDGNNILDVYRTVRQVAEDIRENPRPILIECKTFRMRGHEEASGIKYVPEELFTLWEQRDPIRQFESFLLSKAIITPEEIESLKAENKSAIQQDVENAFALPDISSDLDSELSDVYAPYTYQEITPSSDTVSMRMIDAIKDGLDQSMQTHDDLILMGQDIAEYGGVFKITDGFLEKYGADRVRNTPLCESAIVGVAQGLTLAGMRAMMEMQFADFVTCGFNQIVNNLAKLYYRWGKSVNVVIRMPTGGNVGAGPYHSQSTEAWFFKVPGLKIAYPSNPVDAKGLLIESFRDPNPVLFFEHKALYRGTTGEVPDGYYTVPFGKAAIVQPGNHLTIVTYGLGVQWALDQQNDHVEIIDLRTLSPLDMDTIETSIQKTHRCLVLHEDTITGGIGAEIAAQINERCFDHLDAPVRRLGALDTPVPFAKDLEAQFMPAGRLQETIEALLHF